MSHPSDAFTGIVHPEVDAYLDGLSGADDPVLDRMEAYAATRGFPLVGRGSGRWLELLTRMIGGRRVFEVGSGFGYSAFFFARAVGPSGVVVGTEKDAHELEAFRGFFDGHPLAVRIDLHLGSGLDVLSGMDGDFDVIFLDLGKGDYPAALAAAVPRLRTGGLLLADNVLWGGKVARAATDDDTRALQAFNHALFDDPRMAAAILPVGDGLAVGVRR